MQLRAFTLGFTIALATGCASKSDPVTWDGISGKPAAFPSSWAQVADKPTSYPTAWPDVVGAPVTFPSTWDAVSGKPSTFPAAWADLSGVPASFPSDWAQVANRPGSFPSDWAQIANRPATFPSDWSEVANRPAVFPSDWSQVANKPGAFPTDPAIVQQRVTGTCAGGAAIVAVHEDGSVGCAAARLVTVPLPPPTWAVFQCASLSQLYGLAGMALPSLRFDPTGTCGTIRAASTAVTIPLELAPGARPFRVRAIVSTLDVPVPVALRLEWRVATAGSGVGAFSCFGSQSVTVPALPSVQDITTIEFDFRSDPALCGASGDPVVLSLTRTDAAASTVAVRGIHAVFE